MAQNWLPVSRNRQQRKQYAARDAAYTLREIMKIGLVILLKLSVITVVVYAYVSARAAAWATRRHEGKMLFLEWQPDRARGTQEFARLAQLRRMRLVAIAALCAGATAKIAMFLG